MPIVWSSLRWVLRLTTRRWLRAEDTKRLQPPRVGRSPQANDPRESLSQVRLHAVPKPQSATSPPIKVLFCLMASKDGRRQASKRREAVERRNSGLVVEKRQAQAQDLIAGAALT
jgi:hypothetical protein